MSDNKTIVFFDVQTSGIDTRVCNIIQLSAVCDGKTFNVYMLPELELTDSAKKVTGFRVVNGKLSRHGAPVTTEPLAQAFGSFLDFLRSFPGPVLLVAHSARFFDAPVLRRVLEQLGLMGDFRKVVSGFVDTYPMSKNLFTLPSYSQPNLVRHFLKKSYDAYNALENATMLEELFNKWAPSTQKISMVTYAV